MAPTIASLIVRIGAQDQEIQNALTKIGLRAKSLDADLKKLGDTGGGPLTAGAFIFKMEKPLEQMRATIKEVTKAQEALADRAKFAAQGLEAMGGASRLTDSQLKAVNKTLQDGLSAYRALGQQAPAELQRVADAVKGKLDQPLGYIHAKAVALGAAIGTFMGQVALDIGRALVASAKAAFQYADSLENLSTATGVGVVGLQRIEAVGVKSGISLETLARSVGVLQKNLDSPQARKALAEMELNFAAIRKMKPEDQWFEVAKAIAATEDPIDRANRGAALFGTTWLTIAPAMKGNIEEITRAVKTMSAEQVTAMAEANSAWEQFKKDTDVSIGAFLGDLILAGKKGQLAWQDLLSPQLALQKFVRGGFDQARDFLANMPKIESPFAELRKPPPAGTSFLDRLGDEYDEILKKTDKTLNELNESAFKFKGIQDQLFGRTLITQAEDYVRALGSTENLTKLTATASKKLHDDVGAAIEAYRALGRTVPPILQEIYNKTIPIRTFPVKPVLPFNPAVLGQMQAYAASIKDGTLVTRDFSQHLTENQIVIDDFGNTIKVNLPEVKGFSVQMEEASSVAEEMRAKFKEAFGGIPELLKSAFTGGTGFIGALKAIGVDIADALTAPLVKRLSGLATKFAGVLMGGAGAGAAKVAGAAVPTITGTAIPTIAGTGGAAAGGGAGGGMLAGLGSALTGGGATAALAWTGVGAAIGAAVIGIKAWKAVQAHKEVNRMREVFFDLKGGLDLVNPRVQELTGNVEAVQKVFDARNPKEYEKALARLNQVLDFSKFVRMQGGIEEVRNRTQDLTGSVDAVNRALDAPSPAHYEEALEALTKILDTSRQNFTDLQASVGEVTGKLSGLTMMTPGIEAALASVFDASTTEGYLTAVQTLNGELDKQAKKYSDIESAMEKYGIKFKDAGKEFQQGKINERSKELVADFKLLRGSGADINAVMRGMGKSVRDFIKDAKEAGVEVPESMREVIQVAMDAGEVLDKDGKAIKNMDELGLKFGPTMETTMRTVESAVGRLTKVLEDLAKFLSVTLPKKAEEGAREVNDALDDIEDPVIKPRIDWPDIEPPDFEAPGFQHGSGGVRDFGRGTLAVLHGREAVVTEADLKRGAAAPVVVGPAPVVVHMTINVDGVFSEGDLVQTIQRRVEPIIRQTWEDNVNGARTNAQDILGVP